MLFILVSFVLVEQCLSYRNYRYPFYHNTKKIQTTMSLGFESLDKNHDGHLSIKEIIKSVPNELSATLLSSKLKSILLPSSENAKSFSIILKELRNVVTISDAIIMIILITTHKYVLKQLYTLSYKKIDGIYRKEYKESIWGQLETAVTLTTWFFPAIYLLDMITIILHGIGYSFHIKGDLPRLVCTIGTTLLYGMYFTKIKDWAVNRFIRKNIFTQIKRDPVREATVNELTSIAIWAFLGGFCLEAMSLELGFALGSIFAMGGLGSASLILALRTTIENIIGGIAIKVQDKFRIGELITIPKSVESGIVEDINYSETRMRLPDDSTVIVPNQTVNKMEIINWSRTPFRLFKTTLVISIGDLKELPKLVNDINDRIRKVQGVEVSQRDLIVSASGFKESKIMIDIELHISASNEIEASKVKTDVVSEISEALKSVGIK